MTLVSIESEQLAIWAAELNITQELLAKKFGDIQLEEYFAETIRTISDGIQIKLNENAEFINNLRQGVVDARKRLEDAIEEHEDAVDEDDDSDEQVSDCQVCGKDIDCKTCIMSGQDTCGEEEEPAKEEVEPAVREQEPALSRNGFASWTNDEISVLRTFSTVQDAIEKAVLPGRTESAIKNRYGRLKAEHRILDKSKPFKYIGYAAYLKGKTGTIRGYTDDRTSVNAVMQDGQSIQIKISLITQEGC